MRRPEVTRALYSQAPGLASDFFAANEKEFEKQLRNTLGCFSNMFSCFN
jgi:hypothetical protein